jgi:hypothetical protein
VNVFQRPVPGFQPDALKPSLSLKPEAGSRKPEARSPKQPEVD